MKEEINLKSIVVGLLVVLMGILLVMADLLWWKTDSLVWVSIGCSLIASGMVIVLTALLVERTPVNNIDKWGLEKIYYTRSEQNVDTEQQLEKAKYQVDVVAFGLKSFRDKRAHIVERCLNKGINFRILTMHPDSPFLRQREIEENVSEGSIKDTIVRLVAWANELNGKDKKGTIEIRGYNCMTLDFYWRVDDTVCIGPYWHGKDSQQTITYKYRDDDNNGLGFKQYTHHFEELWDNPELSVRLTQEIRKGKKTNQTRRKSS